MAAKTYMLDQTETGQGSLEPMPQDFLARFVTTAKSNGSLLLERDDTYPDRVYLSGIDDQHRHLLGSWSTHPAHIIDGEHLVVFRDTARSVST